MLVIIILPLIAQAKLISLVSAFFQDKIEEEVIPYNPNSQKISLLEANGASVFSTGGGDIKIKSDSLVSENGPVSSQANVLKEHGDISTYVVQEGDTLSQIAELFGVSPNTIRWGNDIENSTIRPGQILVILPVSGVKHTIASGDTLDKLAEKYNGNVNEILSYNNLASVSSLKVGETIIIPGGVLPEAKPKESSSSSSSGSRGSSSGSSQSSPSYNGYYMRPIAGGTRTQGIHGYNGVDLADRAGAPIFAAAGGKVTVSKTGGWNGGYGNYVVVSHPNGTQTLYAHNNENNVSVGQTVNKGDIIGFIGSTGRSTGNHVHFEVRGAKNPF